jgi:hypothetical protein
MLVGLVSPGLGFPLCAVVCAGERTGLSPCEAFRPAAHTASATHG